MSRPTVLFAWELGGGRHYVQSMLPLARALVEEGFQPILVLSEVVAHWSTLQCEPFIVLRVPYTPGPGRAAPEAFQARSFSDLLAIHGYTDGDELGRRVGVWQHLIEWLAPALILGFFAPTVRLAAPSIPFFEIGSGFNLPPGTDRFPLLLEGPRVVPDEAEILAVVQEVQRRYGFPVSGSLPAAINGDERFLTVLPELDLYGAIRGDGHLGPLTPLPAITPNDNPNTFFAYLYDGEVDPGALFDVLLEAGMTGEAVVDGTDSATRAAWKRPGIRIYDEPIPVAEALERAGFVIHHGGIGLSQDALAAGRPQLSVPVQLEQMLNGVLLRNLGVGRMIHRKTSRAEALEAVKAMRASDLRERAYRLGVAIHERGPWDALEVIMRRCLDRLEQRRARSPARYSRRV